MFPEPVATLFPTFFQNLRGCGHPGHPIYPRKKKNGSQEYRCLHLMDILNLREILVKAVLLAANTTFDSYHVSTTSPGTGRLSALQHSSRDREAFLLHLDQRQLHLCIPGLFEAACRPTCRNVAKLHDHNKYQCFFCIELQKCCKAHSFGTPKGACRGAE